MRRAINILVVISDRGLSVQKPFSLLVFDCSQDQAIKKEKVVNSKKLLTSALTAGFALASAVIVSGQGLVVSEKRLDMVGGTNLYCAGYVQKAPVAAAKRDSSSTANEIIGSYDEQDGWQYSQNNLMVVNAGADKGVRPGDLFSVIRPRGELKSHWTKKGDLGVYVQELGLLEVVQVKGNVSVARVRNSCDTMLLGDLLVPFQPRVSAAYSLRPALDRFGDPSGKATGRIVMARDQQEVLTRDQIGYVDLGAEDNVAEGSYLTIYRYLGKGNPLKTKEFKESVQARQEEYGSFEYRGGRFSNQAPRKRGTEADGSIRTTPSVLRDRPEGLRKVVGEAMVVNVRERVATVVITRVAQEIHTGDWVEIQ